MRTVPGRSFDFDSTVVELVPARLPRRDERLPHDNYGSALGGRRTYISASRPTLEHLESCYGASNLWP